jgi:hypothetical protein
VNEFRNALEKFAQALKMFNELVRIREKASTKDSKLITYCRDQVL